MVEEIVFEDFAKTIQSAGVRMGTNFDKLGKRLDGLNQKLDKILEMLGISLEDKETDYHVLKKNQESARKEMEVGESGDQEVPSSDDILRSVDAPNDPIVKPMKLEDASVGKWLSLQKIEARKKIFIPPPEIIGKLEPTKYAEIEVSQQVPLSLDLESLLCECHMVEQCAENFMRIITRVMFGRSEESHDSLKLFDELLELDVAPISCLFAVSSYGSEDQNDETIIVFDPGGTKFDVFCISLMQFSESNFPSLLNASSQSWLLIWDTSVVFDWLNQLKELLDGAKIVACASFTLYLNSLNYTKIWLANIAKGARLNGLFDVYWKNTKSVLGEL